MDLRPALRRRLDESLAATSLAAVVGAAFDLAFHTAASGVLPPLLYPPAYLAITLAIAAAAALAGALVGGPAIALGAWAAANGAALSGPGLAAGLLLATALPVAASRAWAKTPISRSLFVGLAIAFVVIGWPRFGHHVPGRSLPWLHDVAAPSLFLGAILAAAGAHAALADRRALPRPAWTTAAALLLSLASLAFVGRARPGATPPHYAGASGARPGSPDIILLILDTVRADHLSLYGYHRDTTPRLDAFVAGSDRAVVYPLAQAPASWTVPSHASLFTGLLPSQHGVHGGVVLPGPRAIQPPPIIAKETLAEVLHAAGWRTACVYANGWLKRIPGLSRGFDWYHQPLRFFEPELVGGVVRRKLLPHTFLRGIKAGGPAAPAVVADVLRFMDACSPGPCYVVANFLDAHGPYLPSPPYLNRYEPRGWPPDSAPAYHGESAFTLHQREARYDEGIRQLDASVGDLLDALRARGVLDHAWLVVTADHGEAFDEHGVTEHGTSLYGAQTHVPLVIQPPRGIRLQVTPEAVGLLDVTATLASLAGRPSFGVGRNLQLPVPLDHPVQLEFYGNARKAKEHGPTAADPARAVLEGADKLIERDGRDELYRLDSDPREKKDLAGEELTIVERLKPLLPPLSPRAKGHEGALPSSVEEERALRALGYVE